MKIPYPWSLLLALSLATGPRAQNPLWSLHGPGLVDGLGTSVAGLGDVDGDGYGDFLSGAVQDPRLGLPGYARVWSGRTGRVLLEVQGQAAGDGFGVSVAGVGDVDKDGVADFAVGATPMSATSLPGYVRIYSGKNAALLRELRGNSPGEWFGVSVDGIGDLDGDGHADFVIGAPFDDHTVTNAGVVRVYSGKSGAVLRTLLGGQADNYFGFAVAGAGDVNRDGAPDVIVGTYRDDTAAPNAGRATVYSGKDGRVVWNFLGAIAEDGLGFAVDGAGDVNGDGWDDVLVGALWADPTATDVGSVELYSGRTGFLLRRFIGDQPFDGLGTSVVGLGDVDGDGVPDLAAGAIQGFPPGRSGYARVWSGKTFQTLFTLTGLVAGDWFGRAVAAAGDVNGDGFADVMVGAPHASTDAARGGSAWVFAGKHVGITTNRSSISLATGGVQVLSLDARPVHAGKLYFVLGTSGATKPGLNLGRVTLPLTLDSYFTITLVSPNTPLLRLTLGTLDATGKKTAFFNLPAGLPGSLAGLTLYHSFVVLGPSLAGYEFASLPASVRILP